MDQRLFWQVFRILLTAFAVSVLGLNLFYNSWRNLFWFSHFALIMMVLAVWTGNRLLVSMSAISVLVFHSIWTVVFILQLLTGLRFGSIGYMFDASIPLFIRGLSLFHVIMPFLILYLLSREGYEERGFVYQTVLSCLVFMFSYFISPISTNINWVFGPAGPQETLPQPLYMVLMMLIVPAIIYYPTHRFLKKRFGS